MKKSFSSLMILTVMLLAFTMGPTCIFSRIQVGEEVTETYETPHPYTGQGLVWEQEFYWPDAGYIAVHFSNFDLEKGDYTEISSPDGRFRYIFAGKGKKVKVGKEREDTEISEFWATHIPGNTAIVRLYRKSKNRKGWGFTIDKWARGYERGYIDAVLAGLEEEAMIEAPCSNDDKEWAKCYLGTTMYDKARAVCRLLIGGTNACTGWLLGSEGHIITNNHCISTQSTANNTDYEFMAEGATCSTNCASWGACPGTVEASSGTLIKNDYDLDYTLILLPSNVTSTYGYLQLRDTLPTVGERIYIPQHPLARGKQLAVNSDVDGPYAKVYSTNQTPCFGGPGDIGYYADTNNGSSGSPVLAYDDHLVVALHHCAYCPNRGIPIPSIITDLGASLPANAIGTGPIEPEQNVYNWDTKTWHETIQDAINNAYTGNLLILYAIWFEENVVVNKSVMISGDLTLNHTVDGGSSGDVFTITAPEVTIKWLNIRSDGNHTGIKIESNNNVVDGNNIQDCHDGVYLSSGTTGNVVFNNTITNSKYEGILLYESYGNWLYSNTIIGNTDPWEGEMGILLVGSSNNTIYANTIQDNNNGIYLANYSDNNIIHHNNFVNNYASARILGACTGNQWDNGLTLVTYPPPPVEYPSGGNYWDDNPNCIDNYHGKDQDIPGSDGICDDPYYITSEPGPDEVDRYPLVARWSPMCGNVDGSPDYVINFADIEYLVDFLYGTGTKDPVPPWAADVNCDGSITIGDVALLIDHVNNGTPLPVCCQ